MRIMLYMETMKVMRTEPTETVYDATLGAIKVAPGPPPTRPSIPVEDGIGPVMDRRLVFRSGAYWYFNLRAVSEVYEKDGKKFIDLANEAQWYLFYTKRFPMKVYTREVEDVFIERATEEEVRVLGL